MLRTNILAKPICLNNMSLSSEILSALQKCHFKISTDTRKDVRGSLYFAIKGEVFDGSSFVQDALEKGAVGVVTENQSVTGENIYHVESVLKTLQETALIYRKLFDIPVIAIGGSNGKTTSRELVREVLRTKYKVHSSEGNFNNHIGVPLSILSMNKETQLGIFEVGANHPGEHTELLNILHPTIVIVTNNGLDHLEGFSSPEGVRKANKEIYDWARSHEAIAFVNKDHDDLMEDSVGLERVLYPAYSIKISNSTPLEIELDDKNYPTNLVGDYNLDNIKLVLSIGAHFGLSPGEALRAVGGYEPSLKRSQLVKKDGNTFVVDCYNANPSSMHLALESFFKSVSSSRGIILGDMLELGKYAEEEHKKIVEYIAHQEVDCALFIGEQFRKALEGVNTEHQWFGDSVEAGEWFKRRGFEGFTFLLKGSRGIKVERVIDP
jgi:UDP-N-acetylmuramoyl-tripeptide--D-alanyl-D-alanine ligase